MNKEIMYANKKYVVIDENKNISKPAVFTDNTLDILRYENEKENIDNEITSIEKDIQRIEKYNIESNIVKIFRIVIDVIAPFIIYASVKTYYSPQMINMPLILSIMSACIIYPMSISKTVEQSKYKKEKKNIDSLIRELTQDKIISKKLENKIKELKEEALVTRHIYNDFDIVDVNTKEKVKTRVLKK